MPGWKIPEMRQAQDFDRFRSYGKIKENLEHVTEILKQEDSVLDVGCYKGYLSEVLQHKQYLGIDIFPEFVELARKTHPQAQFECADFRSLQGRWDVVICSRVLIHLPDFVACARKLISLAKRKCILILPVREEDSIVQEESGVYFRHFSKEIVESVGECEVKAGGLYNTVIYGPRLS